MEVRVAVEFSALEYPELGTAVKPEVIYGLVQGAGGVKSVPLIAGKESLRPIPVDNGRVGAMVVIKVLVWVIRVERVVIMLLRLVRRMVAKVQRRRAACIGTM